MRTNLFGVGPFDNEIDGYVAGVSRREVMVDLIADIRRLLADIDVSDAALTGFVRANANRLVAASGRSTLEYVVERFEWRLRHPLPPHPLTARAPTLARLLDEYTRTRADLAERVQAGATALGPNAATAAAEEASALLDDPTISDDELAGFVRSNSWWLIDDSGRHTLERVLAALTEASPNQR